MPEPRTQPQPQPLLLSSIEAAKYTSVSPKLIDEFSKPGRLLAPAVRRIGRRKLFHRPTLERILATLPADEQPQPPQQSQLEA